MGTCLGWAIDNNLTCKIALANATFIAMIKGLTACPANVAIGIPATVEERIPIAGEWYLKNCADNVELIMRKELEAQDGAATSDAL